MSTQRRIQNSDLRLVRPMRQTHPAPQAQSEILADVEYPMLKGACIALRLLEDAGEWIAMFRDSQAFMTERPFRRLFALALQHTTLTNLPAIWKEFKEDFCDDLAPLLVTGAVLVPAGVV